MRDLFLVSPAIALAGLGLAVVVLDLVIRRKGLLTGLAVTSLLVPIGFTISLWAQVSGAPANAETAFFGTMAVDGYSLFFNFLVLGTLVLLLLSSHAYMSRFRRYQGEFIGLVFFSATGLMLLAGAIDLIAIYISLELASLPVVAIAAFLRTEVRSVEAGVKFFVLSALSSAVLLYGFAFIYGATGTVRLVSLDPAVPSIMSMVASNETSASFGGAALLIGAVLAVAGFGFKLSLVPFQMWTPDVYEGSPTPVGAFLAVASKAAAFAVVLRVFLAGLGEFGADWMALFAGLSVVTMTVGNLVAITQRNIKRLLGYSAIAHAGYMLIGVAAAGSTGEGSQQLLGPSSLLFYLGAYAAATLAAFFAVMTITHRTNAEGIDDLAGMRSRSPWAAGVLALSFISLTGIPPTAGFVGKLFLFNAAINADLVWLAIVGVVNSVVSAYYYVRVIRVMYMRPAAGNDEVGTGLPSTVALLVTGAAVIVLGLFPSYLFNAARTAVTALQP